MQNNNLTKSNSLILNDQQGILKTNPYGYKLNYNFISTTVANQNINNDAQISTEIFRDIKNPSYLYFLGAAAPL